MTGKESLNDIAVYSALHHNVLDNSVITIKKDLEELDKLKSEIQTRIDSLQKRQEYLNNCIGDMECYIEFNFNRKKLELLFELKEVLENDSN